MIVRAVILSGFLLLSNAAFAQHPSGSAPAPQPPPPPPTLGLMLRVVPPGSVSLQTTQQQQQEQQREQQQRDQPAREQQQREQQQREQQAREQQQRERQQREQQAREQQQREQQQREQQAREQQQREQQQREQQAREQQQREQQQREQQAREQQQREQQQSEQQAREQQQQDEREREEQERQRQTPSNRANSSSAASPSVNSSVTSPIPATSQVSNGSFATSSKANAATESHVPFRNRRNPGAELDGMSDAIGGGKNTTAKDQDLHLAAPDLLHKPCNKEPCKEPSPKPVLSDPHAKLCKVGQSPGKDNSCVPPILAKKATAPPKTSAVPQACPADQIWNGIQCAPVGAQGCLPGQTGAGPSCQTDCTIATAGAQNYIERLRMARQAKDQACTGNSTQQECQQAESTYNIRLNEYRTFLAGVSTTCTLPDPISI